MKNKLSKFAKQINKAIDKKLKRGDVTYAEIVGVLEVAKHRFMHLGGQCK